MNINVETMSPEDIATELLSHPRAGYLASRADVERFVADWIEGDHNLAACLVDIIVERTAL